MALHIASTWQAARALAVAVLGLALLGACGGGEPADVADVSVPMKGAPVSSPKKLYGGWIAISDGNLDGIEFLEGDKALLNAPGNAMTLGYQLLDGGRVALTDARGRTTLFRTTLAGSTLELAPEGGDTAQRFRRLGKNETLAEAMQKYEQQRQADMEQRVRALQALVEKGAVTLVSDVDPGLGVWRMALLPDHPDRSGSFLESGRIVFDAMSQKDAYDPLTPVRVLPFHGQGAPAGRRSNEIELTLKLDQPIEPADQDKGAGTITLRLSGPLDKQTVKGAARLPGMSALNEVPLTLARDPYDAGAKRYDAKIAVGGGSGPVELRAVAAGSEDRRSETLLKALSDVRFRVLDARGPEPSYFRIQADPATGKISGDVVGADLTGRRPSALPPGLISGKWVDQHGLALLELIIDGSPLPGHGGRKGERFEYTLAVADGGEQGLRLYGWTLQKGGNIDWLSLVPLSASETIEISEEQHVRLAAQKLGAVVEPPARPQPGEEALLLVQATERDARAGQIYHAGGRYSHGNSPARAALHAGAMQVGETAVLRLRYGAPFTAPTAADERNGITSQRSYFKPSNRVPTFTIERVKLE